MEEDFYFSNKQFIKGLMMPKSIDGLMMKRGDVSLAKINGEWKKYTESVPRGRKPISSHDDLVLIGSGKDIEIDREQLSQKQIDFLIRNEI
ncbi:hypothetical protein COJ85_33070 [Bacillus sp. AFS076308]|uniref:hypothetical protein n=1 Tax=unclassified Bacillus (in: firmicutes) TaxID=185979 RepID=UPI000BF5F5D1|nr:MULTISPECIES: hypothetical protein [unclassified Bacillus (in: firmicutes)]PFN75998.1 hypothetical protein COJ85_33070 [Bacillus sp. AFS076308]PGV45971.1 hypothetical protein COD92_30485 [Bacillus sp. AFS037270]